MEIRKYRESDCNEMADLFYNTVHYINSKDYTEEQLGVWATGNINSDDWNSSFSNNYTVVVVEEGVIVGFGDISNSGYLDRLYVHKDYQGMGIGTLICNELEKRYQGYNITTHASITAKIFFENRGYKVIKKQFVERSGIKLINYIMEK